MADEATEVSAELVEELNCRCGKGSKCPKVQVYSDGSVVVSDDEEGCKPVRLNREQAAQLFALLERHGAA